MLQYKHPGIYTREVPSGVRTITAAPTSVALFVGPTRSGIDNRPTRIFNFPDYERLFGGLSQTSSLSYSVYHFFANGGGEAFVLRVPAKNAVASKSSFKRNSGSAQASVVLTALSSGLAGNDLYVEFDSFDIGADPFGAAPDAKRFNMTVFDRITGRNERFTNLSTSSSSARFVREVVNDPATGSKFVKVDAAGIDQPGPKPNGTIYRVALPAAMAASFTNNVNLEINVTRITDAGADDAPNKVALDVPVYAAGDPTPKSIPELIKAAVTAINAAIRANPAAADRMSKLEIEGATFVEGQTSYVRFRVAQPGSGPLAGRVTDATVEIGAPASGDSFAGTFLTVESTNHSRYRLGAAYATNQVVAVTAGVDGDPNGQPDDNAFLKAITDLEGPDPYFNLLCIPDLVRPSQADPLVLQHANAMTVYGEAARICQKKFAFLLVDPLPNVVDAGSAEAWKSLGFSFQSPHAAAYFPNIRVDDGLAPGTIRSHPPSGAIAGVYARIDAQYGPWRAPAGTETALVGVHGPSVELSDADHGVLNPLGLNVIRRFPVFQTVAFGSRTIDGANALASDWKYIPVRRTASFILRSLVENLRWAVHSPNGEELWSQLRVSVTAFMHGLFRRGAFKGVSSREAYFVICDGSTTTSDDINQGIVNIVVGFAPLKPAEFVVISLRQIVQPTV